MTAHGYDWTENVRIPGLRVWKPRRRWVRDQPWLWVDLREPIPEIDPIVLSTRR